MKIEGKLVFKKDGDKKASEFLEELVKEKSKEIKLTAPFEASGTFSKSPTQPDGITPIEIKEPDFRTVKLETIEPKVEKKVEIKVEPKKQEKIKKKEVKKKR